MTDHPSLTPEQEELRRAVIRPQSLGLLATALVAITAALGELWDARFYWLTVAATLLLVLAIARVIVILRSLRRTGPPFDDLRWWWPRPM
jgi:hypothetical protein